MFAVEVALKIIIFIIMLIVLKFLSCHIWDNYLYTISSLGKYSIIYLLNKCLICDIVLLWTCVYGTESHNLKKLRRFQTWIRNLLWESLIALSLRCHPNVRLSYQLSFGQTVAFLCPSDTKNVKLRASLSAASVNSSVFLFDMKHKNYLSLKLKIHIYMRGSTLLSVPFPLPDEDHHDTSFFACYIQRNSLLQSLS